MKKRVIKIIIKVISFIIAFAAVFLVLQEILVPRFYNDSTGIVNGFYELEDNELDVLCLGSSQMFCSIDASLLTEKYGINTYDFGASDQPVFVTKYYYEEAMKTQSPKLVLIEVTKLFNDLLPMDDSAIAWSFTPTKVSDEKFQSLLSIFKGDTTEAVKYCYFPGIAYHNRWTSLSVENFSLLYSLQGKSTVNTSRGCILHDEITPVVISEDNESMDKESFSVPDENIISIKSIVDSCSNNGTKVLFFKSPNVNWTKNRLSYVKAFMDENELEYIDLNDYYNEIDIDFNQDFYDSAHLNKYGAEKITEYLVPILKEYLS